MKKDWFQVKTDIKTGLRYIVKVKDEETKKHKTCDEAITSAFMPEIKDDKYCPVRSFVKYFDALSPKSDSLWQTAKYTPFPVNDQTIWYYGTVGHNKLDNFVTDVT